MDCEFKSTEVDLVQLAIRLVELVMVPTAVHAIALDVSGAMVSKVTVITEEVVELPARSVMVAVKVCEPSVQAERLAFVRAKVAPLQVGVPTVVVESATTVTVRLVSLQVPETVNDERFTLELR